MSILPSLLLIAPITQDWTAYPLPSLSTAPAHAEAPELLAAGSHIALLPDPATPPGYAEASLAPSLLTQLISGHFSRSGLTMVPGSNPLLVKAPAKDHQELKAIFRALDEASQSLQINLQVALIPGTVESLPSPSDSTEDALGLRFNGSVRSGDSITFGARTEHSFIGGYEIDVATDAGTADPHRSSAATGETIHLTCARVSGGSAVHIEGVLDLAKIKELKSFDPDTPDLGEVEQPRLSIAQLAFSGVCAGDEPLRVVIRSSAGFGDQTLFISASTSEDPPPPAVGWAVRDLAFLASEGLALSPPEPGLRPDTSTSTALNSTLKSTSPGSLVGLLSERASTGAEVARIHSTERLLLIPVSSPNAIAKADALVRAIELPLLSQERCKIRYGSTEVDLPTTHGRIMRALIGEEQPWLIDYRTEIAPNTWMPTPVTEVAFDGLCVEARADAGVLSARYWVSSTPLVSVATSAFANLGALQRVERTYAAGSERLERGSKRSFTGLGTALELSIDP